MLGVLNNVQMEVLHTVLEHVMWNIEVSSTEKIIFHNKYTNDELLHNFLSAKKIEGCSEKTLQYYKSTLKKMIVTIQPKIFSGTLNDTSYNKTGVPSKNILIFSKIFIFLLFRVSIIVNIL